MKAWTRWGTWSFGIVLLQSLVRVQGQPYILPEEDVPGFYPATFYPAVEPFLLTTDIVINANPLFFLDRNVIRIRPMGDASGTVNDTITVLPDTWIDAQRSPFCSTHIFSEISVIRFEDIEILGNDTEIVCRPSDPTIAALVQLNPPNLTPNEPGFACTSPPCTPEDINHVLTNSSVTLSLQSIVDVAPTFAYAHCKMIPSAWYADPSCDTRETPAACFERGTGVSGRTVNPECLSCDWDCDYTKQCYRITGLPHISFFQLEASGFLPCLDTNDCIFECCETQTRLGNPFDALQQQGVRHTVECVYRPASSPTNVAACSTGERLLARCKAEAIYPVEEGIANDPASASISPYQCNYTCLYPCTNPTTFQLLECSQQDTLELCNPVIVDAGIGGPHDRQCRSSILDDPLLLCPEGETPVVFKDPVKVMDIGEDPFEPVEESFVPVPPGLLKQCSEEDTQACASPVCLCIQPEGCPNHPTCNAVGTLHQSLLPGVEDVCACDPTFSGSRCESRVYDAECNMGQNLQL